MSLNQFPDSFSKISSLGDYNNFLRDLLKNPEQFKGNGDNNIASEFLGKIPEKLNEVYSRELESANTGLSREVVLKEGEKSAVLSFMLAKIVLQEQGAGELSNIESTQKIVHSGISQKSYDECVKEYSELRKVYNGAVIDFRKNQVPLSSEVLKKGNYCLALSKVLDIPLPPDFQNGEHFLPHLGPPDVRDAMNFNEVAIRVNRTLEGKELEKYVTNLEKLDSVGIYEESPSGVYKDDIMYGKRLLETQYPPLKDHQVEYYKYCVKYLANIMGMTLSEEQMNLQERLPMFGVDSIDLTHPLVNEKLNDVEECHFFGRLLVVDFLTHLIQVSTLLTQQRIRGEINTSSALNGKIRDQLEKNLRIFGNLKFERKEYEKAVKNRSLLKSSDWLELEKNLVLVIAQKSVRFWQGEITIEKWERAFANLLAINGSFGILQLDHDQKVGQKEWLFKTDLEEVEKYFHKLERTLAIYKVAEQVVKGMKDVSKIKPPLNSEERQKLHELVVRFKSMSSEEVRSEVSFLSGDITFYRNLLEAKKIGSLDYKNRNPDWEKFTVDLIGGVIPF